MADVEYSPSKTDLFFPARRGNFFAGIAPDNDAAVCAEMARLAYCRKEPAFWFDTGQITAVLETQGFTAQFFESKGTPDGVGTHSFLALDPTRKLAIVSFRGTDASDPTDIFHDAFALQIPWQPGGRVHAGFAHALAYVQHDLLAAIDAAAGYKTYYTGHSLGAAMATLLASLRKPDHLYTIGSPRVGDNDFLNTLANVNATRFVDCCDLVTRIPPEHLSLTDPYKHFGLPTYIDRNRNLLENPEDDFIRDDRLHASTDYILKYAWISGNVAVRELADHAPINYVAALK